jgi:hypothetical protein
MIREGFCFSVSSTLSHNGQSTPLRGSIPWKGVVCGGGQTASNPQKFSECSPAESPQIVPHVGDDVISSAVD